MDRDTRNWSFLAFSHLSLVYLLEQGMASVFKVILTVKLESDIGKEWLKLYHIKRNQEKLYYKYGKNIPDYQLRETDGFFRVNGGLRF